MYDICVFDLDGTLTDPLIGVTRGFCYALKKLGIDEEPANPERFIGPPLHESFKENYGFTEEETQNAVTIFRDYYGQTGVFENEVYPGIEQLLKTLKDNGKILVVATSKYSKFADIVLKHFNLINYFSFVSGDTYDGNLSKGGKRNLINIALDAVDPERKKKAVIIGDRKHDILGGYDAGIDSIGITWGYGSRDEFTQSGATMIVDTPEELMTYLIPCSYTARQNS